MVAKTPDRKILKKKIVLQGVRSLRDAQGRRPPLPPGVAVGRIRTCRNLLASHIQQSCSSWIPDLAGAYPLDDGLGQAALQSFDIHRARG